MMAVFFIVTIVAATATLGYVLWEEARDRKVMHDLFFSGLETASKIAEKQATWGALAKGAKTKDAKNG